MNRTNYPTSLTDKQWQVIEKILDSKKRKRKHSLSPDSGKGFQVLPKRWIVERTFAWFESYRRLAKDYEFTQILPKQ